MVQKILNITGSVILVLLILAVLPLTVPKLFGYQIYSVMTGSMEPALPVNSIIYVKACSPENLQIGDVITVELESSTALVQTHRVVAIDTQKQQLITKGDANQSADMTPVAYSRILGKVEFHIPMLGLVSQYLQTSVGTAACVATFAAVILLWVLCRQDEKKGENAVT